MFTVDVKCESCGFSPAEGAVFKSFEDWRNNEGKTICPHCKGTMKRVYKEAVGFVFKEGIGPESSKPASYFRNAEGVKQKAIRKRIADKQEKDFYERK